MTNDILRNEQLKAAIHHMEEMAFPIDKMIGILSFMTRTEMDDNPPEAGDLTNTFIVLQDLAGEASNHLEDSRTHFGRFKKECGDSLPAQT